MRTQDDSTICEWVDPPGLRYEPVDGELELLPGLRLLAAPGQLAHEHEPWRPA